MLLGLEMGEAGRSGLPEGRGITIRSARIRSLKPPHAKMSDARVSCRQNHEREQGEVIS